MPTENRSSNTVQMVSVPASKLKKIHRDLDACQKVIWLRGGFDPAYCKDAQDSLKDIDALLTQPAAQHQGEPVAWGALYCGGKRHGQLYNHCDTEAEIERYIHQVQMSDDSIGLEKAPLYLNPPTPDGFSAGDMADQGAKAFAARDPEVEQLRRALGGMLFAFDDGVGQEWSQDLLDYARKLTPAVEFKSAE